MEKVIGFVVVFILAQMVITTVAGCVGCDSGLSGDAKIERIIDAKARARAMCNYPETIRFNDMQTTDSTITFSAENAFGVRETHTISY